MAQRIEYLNKQGQREEASGSDKRVDVSARSDDRSFYVSRDDGQGYVMHVTDSGAVAGEITAYLKNTSSTLTLFIRKVKVSGSVASTWKVAYGDSATATGTAVTPVNMNTASPHAADVIGVGGAGGVGGAVAVTEITTLQHPAGGADEERWEDMLMLGQNQNLTVEYDAGGGIGNVDIHFYMDTLD